MQSAPRMWGDYARKRNTQSAMFASLEHWYGSSRVLVASWEEVEDVATTYLQRLRECQPESGMWPKEVRAASLRCWQNVPDLFPRFEHLKAVLLYEIDSLGRRQGLFKGILFVQQRVNDPHLGACDRGRPGVRKSSILPVSMQQHRLRQQHIVFLPQSPRLASPSLAMVTSSCLSSQSLLKRARAWMFLQSFGSTR